jgi:ribonuclease Y
MHQKRIEKIQQNAEGQAKKLFDASLSQAKEQQTIFQEQIHADKQKVDLERAELREKNQRIAELEQKLILREEKIEAKYEEIEKKFGALRTREEELQKERYNQGQVRQELQDELSKVAKLTTEDAKNLLLKRTEERYEQDILRVIEKKKKDLQIRESEISREILIKSIQQYAGDVTGETTQTLIHLESDDIKGKLI